MNPQLIHALKQVAITIVLSILGILAASQNDVLSAAGLDPLIYGGIISAALAALVRVFEGYKDGRRASGAVANMQESDVGYDQVQSLLLDAPNVKPLIEDHMNGKVDLQVVGKSPSPLVPEQYPGFTGY